MCGVISSYATPRCAAAASSPSDSSPAGLIPRCALPIPACERYCALPGSSALVRRTPDTRCRDCYRPCTAAPESLPARDPARGFSPESGHLRHKLRVRSYLACEDFVLTPATHQSSNNSLRRNRCPLTVRLLETASLLPRRLKAERASKTTA